MTEHTAPRARGMHLAAHRLETVCPVCHHVVEVVAAAAILAARPGGRGFVMIDRCSDCERVVVRDITPARAAVLYGLGAPVAAV